MEANEAQELQEHAEHGSARIGDAAGAFTMSVLAVLVAVTTVLGHRTHTEAVLTQNKATDEWNFYQAHKIRANDTELTSDLLGACCSYEPCGSRKISEDYADHQAKWAKRSERGQENRPRRWKLKWSRPSVAPIASIWRSAAGDWPRHHFGYAAHAQAGLLVPGACVCGCGGVGRRRLTGLLLR